MDQDTNDVVSLNQKLADFAQTLTPGEQQYFNQIMQAAQSTLQDSDVAGYDDGSRRPSGQPTEVGCRRGRLSWWGSSTWLIPAGRPATSTLSTPTPTFRTPTRATRLRVANGQRFDGPLLKRITGVKRGFESRRSRSTDLRTHRTLQLQGFIAPTS